jgi:hypothetical protein
MGVLRLASGAYTARVRHHDSAGLRVSLGRFSTEQAAIDAVDRYARTGELPDMGRPRFRGVYQTRSGWFYEFEGEIFGPFGGELEAAWRRRRDRDNVTQRARRAVQGYSKMVVAAHVLSSVKTHAMTTRRGALSANAASVSDEKNNGGGGVNLNIISGAPCDAHCKAQDENLLIDDNLTLAQTCGEGLW